MHKAQEWPPPWAAQRAAACQDPPPLPFHQLVHMKLETVVLYPDAMWTAPASATWIPAGILGLKSG